MENTSITTNTQDNAVIQSKREAWANMGVAIYQTETQLANAAKEIGESISVLPTTIEDVPNAELSLKTAKASANLLVEKRKSVTSKFDEVAQRLMTHEKSLSEPIKQMEGAIISVKKAHEAAQRLVQEIADEKAAVKKYAIDKLIEIDASCKNYINELISRAYTFALENNVAIDSINEYITKCEAKGLDKISETYAIDKRPKGIRVFKFPQSEADVIFEASFNFDIVEYKEAYKTALKAKFSDYEVAFNNKAQALEADAKAKQEADALIKQEALNNTIAATMEATATSFDAVPDNNVKALKKSYEIYMDETFDNAMKIMSAFIANKEKCLPRTSTKKWFSFGADSAGKALAKVKCDDNSFSPLGIIFKEVYKS